MPISKKVPRIIGNLTLFIGLFIVVSNVSRKFHGPRQLIDTYFLVYLNSAAFATVLFTGVVLILLSSPLKKRKRRGWHVAISILIINMIFEFFRFHVHFTQIALSAFLLLILIIFRAEFYAKSDPSTRYAPLKTFFFASTIFTFLGILLFYFRLRDNILGDYSFQDVLGTVLSGLVWQSGNIELKSRLLQDTLQVTLGAFGIFILLIPMWSYFRKVSSISHSSTEEKLEIKSLIKTFGDDDSLAYFATRDDKSLIWSSNRKAGIAYRVENGVMIASGDPFGEYSIWPDAIANFVAKAEEFAWSIAVLGASEIGGKAWIDNAGMSAIEIGDEAIIDVKDFSLEGRSMSNLRQTLNKANRRNLHCEVKLVSQLSVREIDLIRARGKEWRGDNAERGFSMGMDRFMGEIDGENLLVQCFYENELVGFLHFVPWGKVGYSLDRMQRSGLHLPGITELMIEKTILYCVENRYRYISLNFAAFRSVIERAEKISAGPLLRATRSVIRVTSGWFQIESLYRFNAKFQPSWKPRYLLYSGATELVPVVWGALKAEKFLNGFKQRSLS